MGISWCAGKLCMVLPVIQSSVPLGSKCCLSRATQLVGTTCIWKQKSPRHKGATHWNQTSPCSLGSWPLAVLGEVGWMLQAWVDLTWPEMAALWHVSSVIFGLLLPCFITTFLCIFPIPWGHLYFSLKSKLGHGIQGLPQWLSSQESACNARDAGDRGSIPGSGRYAGGGYGIPLQYSFLENPMDRGAWQATVYRGTMSWTRPKWLSMHTCIASEPLQVNLLRFKIHTHTHTHTRIWLAKMFVQFLCNILWKNPHKLLANPKRCKDCWVPKNWCFWAVGL